MATMDFNSLYRDRRPPETIEAQRAYRERELGPVEDFEQNPEVEFVPEQMDEATLIDSVRFPSAHPGKGTMVVPRVRDRDLCRHCFQPMIAHGAGFEHHAPERMPGGKRTHGSHADVEDGRARSTQPSGLRSTPRFGID